MSDPMSAPDPRTFVHCNIAPPMPDIEPAEETAPTVPPVISGWHVAAGLALVAFGIILGRLF